MGPKETASQARRRLECAAARIRLELARSELGSNAGFAYDLIDGALEFGLEPGDSDTLFRVLVMDHDWPVECAAKVWEAAESFRPEK